MINLKDQRPRYIYIYIYIYIINKFSFTAKLLLLDRQFTNPITVSHKQIIAAKWF